MVLNAQPCKPTYVLANCVIKFNVPVRGDLIGNCFTFDSGDVMMESLTIGNYYFKEICGQRIFPEAFLYITVPLHDYCGMYKKAPWR